MIQGAINQLLAMGAAAKKAGDIADTKAARTEIKVQKARERAMQRMRAKVQAKWDQNKEYQSFKASLGKDNQAPEALKRIAFEAQKNAPDVRIDKDKINISSLGPEAQEAIRRAK